MIVLTETARWAHLSTSLKQNLVTIPILKGISLKSIAVLYNQSVKVIMLTLSLITFKVAYTESLPSTTV